MIRTVYLHFAIFLGMLIRLSPLRDLSRFMNSDGDSVSGKATLHSGPHSFACSGVILASRSKFIKKCLTGGSDIILPQEIQPEQVIQVLLITYLKAIIRNWSGATGEKLSSFSIATSCMLLFSRNIPEYETEPNRF